MPIKFLTKITNSNPNFDDKRKALNAVTALRGVPAQIFVERICKK